MMNRPQPTARSHTTLVLNGGSSSIRFALHESSEQLRFLGIELHENRNAGNAALISERVLRLASLEEVVA